MFSFKKKRKIYYFAGHFPDQDIFCGLPITLHKFNKFPTYPRLGMSKIKFTTTSQIPNWHGNHATNSSQKSKLMDKSIEVFFLSYQYTAKLMRASELLPISILSILNMHQLLYIIKYLAAGIFRFPIVRTIGNICL